jgi:hypothetical protein
MSPVMLLLMLQEGATWESAVAVASSVLKAAVAAAGLPAPVVAEIASSSPGKGEAAPHGSAPWNLLLFVEQIFTRMLQISSNGPEAVRGHMT